MIDQEQIRRAALAILEAIGEDTGRKGLAETPRRVAEAYAELFSGVGRDPREALSVGFDAPDAGLIVFTDLPFFSMCEHHLLPFIGRASVGYMPNGRVVGASKISRALDILAHRPQMQERLTAQLADAIADSVGAQGVAVSLKAEHLCMSIRGIKKPCARMATSAYRGQLLNDHELRREFWSMTGNV